MNERIKELAEQAMRNVESTNSYHSMVFDKEKFAQLIVSDIVGAIRGLQRDAQIEGRNNIADTCNTIAGLIEIDYGVKND